MYTGLLVREVTLGPREAARSCFTTLHLRSFKTVKILTDACETLTHDKVGIFVFNVYTQINDNFTFYKEKRD